MTVQFESQIPHSVEETLTILTDREFLRKYAYETGSSEADVTVSPDGLETVVRRVMPTDEVPGFVRGFLGESLPVVETVTWAAADGEGARRAVVLVETKVGSRSATFRGELQLSPSAEGSTCFGATGSATVKIPLIGGRVAPLVEEAVRAALEVQAGLAVEWPAR